VAKQNYCSQELFKTIETVRIS